MALERMYMLRCCGKCAINKGVSVRVLGEKAQVEAYSSGQSGRPGDHDQKSVPPTGVMTRAEYDQSLEVVSYSAPYRPPLPASSLVYVDKSSRRS
jgi:hypothetical protein